jgi:hypothetical protein
MVKYVLYFRVVCVRIVLEIAYEVEEEEEQEQEQEQGTFKKGSKFTLGISFQIGG